MIVLDRIKELEDYEVQELKEKKRIEKMLKDNEAKSKHSTYTNF